MHGSDVAWSNEAGTVYTLCEAHKLLDKVIGSINLGPYATHNDFKMALPWLNDLMGECRSWDITLTICIHASTITDAVEIVQEMQRKNLQNVELDVTPLLFPRKDGNIVQQQIDVVNRVLTAVRVALPFGTIALKIPVLSENLLDVIVRYVSYHNVKQIVAVSQKPTGVVLTLRPALVSVERARELKQLEALEVVQYLNRKLLYSVTIWAAADIATLEEAYVFLQKGATCFQVGSVIKSRDAETRLKEFNDAFRY